MLVPSLPMNSMFPLYQCSLYQWTACSRFTIVPSTNEQQVHYFPLFPLYQWTASSLFTIVPSLPMNSRFHLYYCSSLYQRTTGSLFTNEQHVHSLKLFPLYQWAAGSLFTIVPSLPMNSRFPLYQGTAGSLFPSEQQVYSLPMNSRYVFFLPVNSGFPLYQWTASLLFTSEQQVHLLPVNSRFTLYQCMADKGLVVTALLFLPHMPTLLMMSLIQTVSRKKRLKIPIFNETGQDIEWRTTVYIFFYSIHMGRSSHASSVRFHVMTVSTSVAWICTTGGVPLF